MNTKGFNKYAFLLLAVVFVISSCRKKYDAPPAAEIPNLSVTMTIAQVQDSVNQSGAQFLHFDESSSAIIGGVVIADDKSGNFYKTIVIQDSTAGVSIPIDAYDLYNEYPEGRMVYVKLAGLYIVKSGGLMMVSATSDPDLSRIPQATYRQFIIAGTMGHTVTPKVRTLSSLTPDDYNTLITINDVELGPCYYNSTYANTTNPSSGVDVELYECVSGKTTVLRNSDFADFAGELMPNGNGSITVVYSAYQTEDQMLIRRPSDMNFPNSICMTDSRIDSVRALFFGGASNVGLGRTIKGIVTSDDANGNIDYKSIAIQDHSGAAIIVRFTDAVDGQFEMGDSVIINITNQTFNEYRDLLQINEVENYKACVKSSGNTISPRITTISDILINHEDWEATLVQIPNCTISGGSFFNDSFGNLTLSDGTGSITLRTVSDATFYTNAVPTGTVTVTAILSEYNGASQLLLRNLNDIQ